MHFTYFTNAQLVLENRNFTSWATNSASVQN